MEKVEKGISKSQEDTQLSPEKAQKAEAIRRAFEEQVKEGIIPFQSWEFSPDDKYDQYFKKDFPAFIKRLRNELLGLTMEVLGNELGVTKNHVAKMESGSAKMGKSVQLLFFDLVNKKLKERKELWNSLGKDVVDQLIPDHYKQRRGWIFDREVTWVYSENSSLIVRAATPPPSFDLDEHNFNQLLKIGQAKGIKKKGRLLVNETLKGIQDEIELSKKFKKSDEFTDLNRQIHEYEETLFKTTDDLLKTNSEMELLKQELKSKEEMLSLKDELIAELRDRIELMKKLTNDKDG